MGAPQRILAFSGASPRRMPRVRTPVRNVIFIWQLGEQIGYPLCVLSVVHLSFQLPILSHFERVFRTAATRLVYSIRSAAGIKDKKSPHLRIRKDALPTRVKCLVPYPRNEEDRGRTRLGRGLWPDGRRTQYYDALHCTAQSRTPSPNSFKFEPIPPTPTFTIIG